MSLVSMYTDLVEAALAEVTADDGPASSDQALAEVIRRRTLLGSKRWQEAGRPDVPATLADEVAYDVALIRLARALHVDCDPRNFGWPQGERTKVERALVSEGVLAG